MKIPLIKKLSPELIEKAKQIVKTEYPDAFCQEINTKITVGTYPRAEYVIQRLIKSKSNEDGDEREDLSPTAFSEDEAWIYAADRVSKYDDYYFYNEVKNG